MDSTGTTPSADKTRYYDDEVDEDLWASPSRAASKKTSHGTHSSVSGFTSSESRHHDDTSFERQEVRHQALRKELESVRKVNAAIEGVISTLNKAKSNMNNVNHTVGAASTLLNTWTRILSQTEHNQRLILNPAWQGASQELADEEQENLAKQQAAQRREFDEQQRRDAAARKAEEEERRRSEAAAKASRGSTTRGRTRGVTPGRSTTPSSTSNSYVGVGGQSSVRGGRGISTGGRRTTSGIGRGVGSTRGRARG